MSARSVGLGSMFGWIPSTFGMVKRNFGAMSVASILNLLAILLLMAPMFYVMYRAFASGMGAMANPAMPFGGADLETIGWIYGFMMLAGLLLLPPMMAGWFRLCENADRGAHVRGSDIFRPYADIPLWLRLIGFVLLICALYLLVGVLLFLAFRGVFMQFVAMQAAQQAAMMGGAAATPPSMAVIGHMLLAEVVILPVMLLLQFVYMVGLAEVSLRSTPVLVAFKDALATVLRNSLKMLVWLFVVGIGFIVVMFVLGLVFALVGAVLSMISPGLMAVLMMLLYVPLLLVMYPLMFSGYYVAWKSLLGSEPPMPPASAGSVAA
jgi:hypothetical protein